MSSISDEKAVITLEVQLISTVSGLEGGAAQGAPGGFLGEMPPDMNEAIKDIVDDSIKESIEDALKEEGIDTDTLENLTNNLKAVDQQGMQTLTKFAKNPAGFMESTFMSILARAGPYGAIIAAIIAAIVAAPEVVKAVVEAFGVKGGPLNQDYRYSQEEFLSQEFDRITQFKRLTGDDPVITVNTVGFVVGDPDFKGNSLVDANVARSGRVGLRDSSYGYIHGI